MTSCAMSENVAVIGAGTMGSGIAFVAAQHGHDVTLVDLSEAGLERGRDLVAGMLKSAQARGILDAVGVAELLARITFVTQLENIKCADLVIEAIVEERAAKATLIEAACRIMGGGSTFLSNTSSISVAELARHCPRPERFAGLHFFNPVPAMKLVEVIPGPDTTSEVVAHLVSLMTAWGKVPVLAQDVPGFIVNNVARPYYGEGLKALEDGLSPGRIDALLCKAGGFRMGPLALADMIGHDINLAVARSVYNGRHGNARFRPSQAQAALVEQGRLGRKTGRGIYDYAKDGLADPELMPVHRAELLKVAVDPAGLADLVEALRAAGVVIETDSALPKGMLEVNGVRMAQGDGRTLESRAETDVLLDAVREWSRAAAVGATVRTESALSAVRGLFDILGLPVHVIPDRPGQIVLRTLVQIANAAADALYEGVASAEHIDTALRLGANHPEGPLAWTARAGAADVRQVLENIAHATGDAMYLPSAGFASLEVA